MLTESETIIDVDQPGSGKRKWWVVGLVTLLILGGASYFWPGWGTFSFEEETSSKEVKGMPPKGAAPDLADDTHQQKKSSSVPVSKVTGGASTPKATSQDPRLSDIVARVEKLEGINKTLDSQVSEQGKNQLQMENQLAERIGRTQEAVGKLAEIVGGKKGLMAQTRILNRQQEEYRARMEDINEMMVASVRNNLLAPPVVAGKIRDHAVTLNGDLQHKGVMPGSPAKTFPVTDAAGVHKGRMDCMSPCIK